MLDTWLFSLSPTMPEVQLLLWIFSLRCSFSQHPYPVLYILSVFALLKCLASEISPVYPHFAILYKAGNRSGHGKWIQPWERIFWNFCAGEKWIVWKFTWTNATVWLNQVRWLSKASRNSNLQAMKLRYGEVLLGPCSGDHIWISFGFYVDVCNIYLLHVKPFHFSCDKPDRCGSNQELSTGLDMVDRWISKQSSGSEYGMYTPQ